MHGRVGTTRGGWTVGLDDIQEHIQLSLVEEGVRYLSWVTPVAHSIGWGERRGLGSELVRLIATET